MFMMDKKVLNLIGRFMLNCEDRTMLLFVLNGLCDLIFSNAKCVDLMKKHPAGREFIKWSSIRNFFQAH